MHARRFRWTAVLLALAVTVGTTAAFAAPPAEEPLTTEGLIYGDAAVEVQVDVNGEAVVELIGGLLDAVAEIAQEQVPAMAQGGPVPPAVAAMAVPLIEPAKNAIKSITRVAVVVMKPAESVSPDEAMAYYQHLMTSRGWTPMITVRADKGERVLVLTAPGGKGIFANVVDGSDMIVAMITTTEPLGDLLGQIVRAGGAKVLPAFLAAQAHAAPPHPPEAPPSEESAPEAPAE